MLTQQLIDLHYTPAQAAVLEAVVKIGESRAGDIIKETGLQSSVVYNALRQLQEKGLLTTIKKDSVQSYICPDPNHILEIAQQDADNAKQVASQLSTIASMAGKDTLAHVFYGWDGLLAGWKYAMKNGGSKKTKYFAIPGEWLTERCALFFNQVDNLEKEMGIHVRGLARSNERIAYENYFASEIRYTDSAIPLGTTIFGKCLFILNLSNKPRAVLIESAEIALIYDQMWEQLWKKAKK